MGSVCCPAAAPSPVIVHIYDVTGTAPMKVVNEVLRPLGTGAFHAAVEVHGKEWSYGQTMGGHGIFENPPKECEQHTYRESIHMGYTDLTPFEVQMLIADMAKRWRGRQCLEDQVNIKSRSPIPFIPSESLYGIWTLQT